MQISLPKKFYTRTEPFQAPPIYSQASTNLKYSIINVLKISSWGFLDKNQISREKGSRSHLEGFKVVWVRNYLKSLMLLKTLSVPRDLESIAGWWIIDEEAFSFHFQVQW